MTYDCKLTASRWDVQENRLYIAPLGKPDHFNCCDVQRNSEVKKVYPKESDGMWSKKMNKEKRKCYLKIVKEVNGSLKKAGALHIFTIGSDTILRGTTPAVVYERCQKKGAAQMRPSPPGINVKVLETYETS